MSSRLTIGTIFAERYRVERCLAQGGMGEVYEVTHLETERRRALKIMHAHVLLGDDSVDLRERFRRESRVAAHVESEFIVDVFDAGIDEATGQPFLVMELLRGEELGQRLKRLGRIAPEEAVIYLHQTALALDKTHKAAIVHRDIKPGNIFITAREDGQPWIKVLDFGIAKIIAESTTGAATQALGTPLYMAPEQFDPHARITAAADIYSLGMVAYTLLTGRAYWAPETKAGGIFALAAIAAHGPREPASVRAAARRIELPPGFDAWFARITARDPAQRYPSATEAIRALGITPALARVDSSAAFMQGAATISSPELPREPPTAPSLITLHTALPERTSLLAEPSQAVLVGATTRPASFPTLSHAALSPPRSDRTKTIVGAGIVLVAGIAIGLGGNALRSSAPALSSVGSAATGSALPAPPTDSAIAALTASTPDPSPPIASATASASARPPAASASVKPVPPRIPPPRKYTRD